MARWLWAALVVILSGCAAAPRPLPLATTTLMAQGRAPGLSYSYPSGWSTASWSSPSSFTFMVAAISNQRLRNPCFHHGNVYGCGQPLGSLQPGAMLVEWWENGDPRWLLADQPGSPISVDGLPAKMEQGASALPACSGLEATGAISVVVARPQAPGNYWEFLACMRGPHLSRQTSLAMAMLNSARFSSG